MTFVRRSRSGGSLLVVALLTALAVGACGSSHGSTKATAAPTAVSSGTSQPAPVVAATTTTTPRRGQLPEPSLPIAVQEGAAASTNDRLYVMGGYDVARNSSAAVFVFDGSAWQRGPSLPIAVNHPGAAAIGRAVYVAGGFTANGASNRVFVLDANAGSWREVAPLHRRRGALALLSMQGHLYAIGGRDDGTQVARPETYDPGANVWRDLPAMPEPRNHVAGYVNGALLCVAGGRNPQTTGAIDCLDSRTETWQRQSPLPIPTSGAAATLIDGVTVVAGGEPSNETRLTEVVQLLQSRTWTDQPMLVPRHGTAFSLYRGRLWMCGGATAPGYQAVATCTSLQP
jgi:Kelch motif